MSFPTDHDLSTSGSPEKAARFYSDTSVTGSARSTDTALEFNDISMHPFQENPKEDIDGVVKVQTVLDAMQEDVCVVVKLFYTPHDVSRPTSVYKNAKQIEFYETKVGCNESEYTSIAKDDTAHKAQELLAPFSGKVLRLAHVKHSDHKGEAQLALMIILP